MTISLIVGLGNPGEQYAETRHNAGFWLLQRLSTHFRYNRKFNANIADISIANHRILLVAPLSLMNRSGDVVQKVLHFYKIKPENLLVAHDELDFPPGICKLKAGGGHSGHNGLRDIIQKISSRDFLRLRIGIGHPGDTRQVSHYVLKSPSTADRQAIEKSLTSASQALGIAVGQGLEAAMLALHTR